MQSRWVFLPDPDPDLVSELAGSLNDLPVGLARALLQRGIQSFEDARRFFRASLSDLHDPFEMKDMKRAVQRLKQAHEEGETVLVYGDYDVDGTTSTAMMTHFLRLINVPVSYWIPHRIRDGYGLCKAGIDAAVTSGAKLIVALDCGVTAIEEVQYASQCGVDVIICDHHTPGDMLPAAAALLNPKRPDCTYPFKELAGCGVGFKFIQALGKEFGLQESTINEYLDLVAISTASDIVPLEGENRILMREGMKSLGHSSRIGLKRLAQVSKVDLSKVSSRDIVFGIGPRINAAGRLDEAGQAVDLLLCEKEQQASMLANRLNQANEKRRDMDKSVFQEAVLKAERQLSNDCQHSIVVHDPSWHPGIVGIVASRLVERFYRPSIMLTTVDGEIKGSARSIHGVNVYNALAHCSDLLTRFGGHDYAAGLSLKEENLSLFKERFNDAIGSVISPELMAPVIEVDARVVLDEIDRRFYAVLKQFAPFGPANRDPVFHAQDLLLTRPPVRMGRDGSHIKFWVKQSQGGRSVFEVVGFKMHAYFDTLRSCLERMAHIELLFNLTLNTWNGVQTLQLKARDLRIQKSTI